MVGPRTRYRRIRKKTVRWYQRRRKQWNAGRPARQRRRSQRRAAWQAKRDAWSAGYRSKRDAARLTAGRWRARTVDAASHRARPVAVFVDDEQRPEVVEAAGLEARYAGQNRRFATMTAAVFSRDDRLIVGYLLSSTIGTVDLPGDGGRPSIAPGRVWGDLPGVRRPTGLAVSRDRRRLAITNSGDGTINVMTVDPVTGEPGDILASHRHGDDRSLHGVDFSADGRFVVYSSISKGGGLRVLELVGDDGSLSLVERQVEPSPSPLGLPIKGIRFTPDGRFLAYSFGMNASKFASTAPEGCVELRRWDAAAGTVGEVVSSSDPGWHLECGEDVAFSPDGRWLAVSDNFTDQVLIASVDPATGALGRRPRRIGRAWGGLRSPHGVSVSPDGRWLLVCSYGDSSLRLFDARRLAS